MGLSTPTKLVKIDFRLAIKSLYIETLINVILFMPFSVKSSLLWIKLTNNKNKICMFLS